MNIWKQGIITFTAAIMILFTGPAAEAISVREKAANTRVDLIRYIRSLRPMAFNFPCEPFPSCRMDLSKEEQRKEPWDRVKRYHEIKRIYQEGLIYQFEGNYITAYNRYLDAQARVDNLMEELSQSFIDRAQVMLRDAIEKQFPDSPVDRSVVDISMELGQKSKLRRDFDMDREAGFEERRYNPKLYRFARNKYSIEANMQMGYDYLGKAKSARVQALRIAENMPDNRKLDPRQRRSRIELYMDAIEHARQAKFNAEFIFRLKYPYENYAYFNPTSKNEAGIDREDAGEIPAIQGVKIKWSEHPHVLPKNMHPIFNLSIPETYRIDVVDVRNLRYDDEVDVYLDFKHRKSKPKIVVDDGSGGQGSGDDQGGGDTTN